LYTVDSVIHFYFIAVFLISFNGHSRMVVGFTSAYHH